MCVCVCRADPRDQSLLGGIKPVVFTLAVSGIGDKRAYPGFLSQSCFRDSDSSLPWLQTTNAQFIPRLFFLEISKPTLELQTKQPELVFLIGYLIGSGA